MARIDTTAGGRVTVGLLAETPAEGFALGELLMAMAGADAAIAHSRQGDSVRLDLTLATRAEARGANGTPGPRGGARNSTMPADGRGKDE